MSSSNSGKTQNPGQIGKGDKHNAMDRERKGSGPTFTNPGAQNTGQGGSRSDPNEEGGEGRDRQVDDNQDDLGNDVNNPGRSSTNNQRK